MKYINHKDIRILPPKKGGHKGDNGRVLVIGGSKDYSGAPYLSAMAALKIGADYITIACPKKVGWTINKLSPDLITKKYDCEYFSPKEAKDVLEFSEKFDAVLIGNGISSKNETMKFVKLIINRIKKPLVIDADALKAVDIKKLKNTILTPHKREFEILMKNSDLDLETLKNYLKNNVIIRKGKIDEIITNKKIFYNKTGCDRMAVAGTGDVLAGLTVGLLAKGLTKINAAKTAAYVNGVLGEKAKKKLGNNFTASDLLTEIKNL